MGRGKLENSQLSYLKNYIDKMGVNDTFHTIDMAWFDSQEKFNILTLKNQILSQAMYVDVVFFMSVSSGRTLVFLGGNCEFMLLRSK